MSTDAATKRPPRSSFPPPPWDQSAVSVSGPSHWFFSVLSSALAAAFSDLPSVLSAALVVLAVFSDASSAALAFVSDASSVVSAALQVLSLVDSDSLFDSDLLEAMALTHWPCTPFGPLGHVSRAADATASPCESELVRVTAPTLARTPAVPSANTAPPPTKRKRILDILPSTNKTPSSVAKKNPAGAGSTQIEVGAPGPV